MTISYAGAAYVGNCPTDEWIAQKLIGEHIVRFDERRVAMFGIGRLRLKPINQALWLLEKAVEAEKSFRIGLELSVGGWRIHRKRLIPFLASIERTGNKTKRSSYMRMPRKPQSSGLHSAGQLIDFGAIKAAAAAYPDRVGMFKNPEIRSKFLAEVVQHVSIKNEAAGADIIAVELVPWKQNCPREIVIRYRPVVERLGIFVSRDGNIQFPAAYWPWVITPFGYKAPSISTGGGQWSLGPVNIRYECPNRPVLPGNLVAESSISRPLPPR